MSYSNTEWAMKEIFNCGFDDLSIIDDAGVDICEYLDSTDKECISLENLVRFVVNKANETLQKNWEVEKEEIMQKIKELKEDMISECGEDYLTENPNDSEVRIIRFYEEKADNVIKKGLSLYFNYLDTHISIPYADELREFFLLEEPEDIIGFTGISTGYES